MLGLAGFAGDGRRHGVAIGRRAVPPLRAVVVAGALALGAGGALYESQPRDRSPSAPPVASAHLTRAPQQGLYASFTSSGVSVTSGAAQLRLSARGAGYGSSLTALASVTPRASANRVTYVRPGIEEWYANGPLGLEQGFTLAHAPAGRAFGPLTVSLALSGNLMPAVASGGQALTLTRAGKIALRYDGLRVTDARDRALHSWMQLRGSLLMLRVDASGAHYPLRIDPFVQQTTFKHAIVGALSASGNTALVRRFEEHHLEEVLVFTRSGETWTQQAELVPAGQVGRADFGKSMALSADGNTALVGGPEDNESVGAAWVFTRSGETWSQQGGKLTPSGAPAKGHFGENVALSTDGNTALIASPGHGAYAFIRAEGAWTQQGSVLTSSKEKGFGASVALSADGNSAFTGSTGAHGDKGALLVFTRSGGTWTEQKELSPLRERKTGFGGSVAVSEDGNTVLAGAPYPGHAYVFTRTGSLWSKGAVFKSPQSRHRYGQSVALSGNGNTALVGSPGNSTAVGRVYIYDRSGETWTIAQNIKRTGEGEGADLAFSADGSTALIGGLEHLESASENGFTVGVWVNMP